MANDTTREEFEQSPRFRGMDFQRAPEAPDYYLSPYANGAWDGWKAAHALTTTAQSLLAERDRLQARVEQLQAQVKALTEERDKLARDNQGLLEDFEGAL